MTAINLRGAVRVYVHNLVSTPLSIFGQTITGGPTLTNVWLHDLQDPSWDRLVSALRYGTVRVTYPGLNGLAEKIVKAALNEMAAVPNGLLFVSGQTEVASDDGVTTLETSRYAVDPSAWEVGSLMRVRLSGRIAAQASADAVNLRLRLLLGTPIPIPGQTGLTASLVASPTAMARRLTGLTGMTGNSVGRSLVLSGTGGGKANGSFVVAKFVSPTSVDVYADVASTVPDSSNGAISWTERQNDVLIDTRLVRMPLDGLLASWSLAVDVLVQQNGKLGSLLSRGTLLMPGAIAQVHSSVGSAVDAADGSELRGHGVAARDLLGKQDLVLEATWDVGFNSLALETVIVEVLRRAPVTVFSPASFEFSTPAFALFGGGVDVSSVAHANVDKYTFASDVVSTGTVLGQARSYPGAAGNRSVGVFSGGRQSGSDSQYTDRCQYADDTVRRGSNLLDLRNDISAAGNQDVGIFAGGYHSGEHNTAYHYSYANDTFLYSSDQLGRARTNLAAAGNASFAVFSGGYTGVNTAYTDLYFYTSDLYYAIINTSIADDVSRKVVQASDQNVIRSTYSATGGLIYGLFVGGIASGPNLATTSKYGYATFAWTAGANLGQARQGTGSAATRTLGVIGGGYSGSFSAYVDKYAFASDTVSAGTALGTARSGVSAVSSAPGGF